MDSNMDLDPRPSTPPLPTAPESTTKEPGPAVPTLEPSPALLNEARSILPTPPTVESRTGSESPSSKTKVLPETTNGIGTNTVGLSRPHSRAASGTPQMLPRTPKPGTPRPQASGTDGAVASAGGRSPSAPELNRPLNVTDALSYLDAVKVQFHDRPDVYNHFLDIMKDFKSQVIDTPGVIERVSLLFTGNPYLIQGFNTFLPMGYRIDVSADLNDNMITVTTPMGTTRQSTNAFGPALPPPARDIPGIGPPSSGLSTPGLGPPFQGPPSLSPLPPIGPGSRSITPHQFHLTHGAPPPYDAVYSPGFPGAPSTTAAASFLGGLSNRNPVENKPAGEFNHAIQYLNKIKARYSDDPNTYKQFLEILQTYQKEQRHLQDSQVYAQVQMLFKDAPDLLGEFKDFLPEALGFGSAASGAIGILPQPTSGPASNFGQSNIMASDKAKKAIAPIRRKKRPAEKETTPAPSARGGTNRSKKAKHHHKPDQSPPFSPYQGPSSPPHNHTQAHPHSSTQASHQPSAQHALQHPSTHGGMTTPEELRFFDRAKKTLESRDTYDEFLKLLGLFSKDIIDTKTLIQRSQTFLDGGDLWTQFKELMSWDDKQEGIDHGPPGSVRMGPPEALSALPLEDGQGPSYRKLPESEVRLACSGRDELCRAVLNDIWVSHPTWASEEAGFVAHKKNSFEEALHKSEEERHEYHVQLEALTRTIAILEPVYARIEEMTNEDRAVFKLKADFGGSSKSIYHRTLKKVYGRDAGLEVIAALQDCPAVAVPVVLARLKQKDDEWRRSQREWSRTWRDIDSKNFYKSLDHQGIIFKANDKKNITAKHFVADIEAAKANQVTSRELNNPIPSFTLGSVGHQLEYSFVDTSVLHDSLKMVYSFLDHNHALYSPQERRGVEKFLRSFIPALCMYPAAEFNAACGPLDGVPDDDSNETNGSLEGQRSGRRSASTPQTNGQSSGVPASDLRKKLLRTVQEKSSRESRESASAIVSRATSPGLAHSSLKAAELVDPVATSALKSSEEFWIRESVTKLSADDPAARASAPERRSFFANMTFYTLLRLLQLLYSRLLMCKEIGAQLAAEKHQSLQANPTSIELGLDDPNGPSVVLAQAKESLDDHGTSGDVNVIYMYLLDACEKVFDNELDPATFEEHMRWFFGNKAYHVFTLDKLITALVKQVQTILLDSKCQDLWTLLQDTRTKEPASNRDIILYRREAERHVGLDDHLYRIEWMTSAKRMHIQLVGCEDPSVDENKSAVSRWREYVDTFVSRHPTEWLPKKEQEHDESRPLFLRRCIGSDDGQTLESNMRIRISLGTYKLFYETGSEDYQCRRRSAEDELTLGDRAKARHEERKRCRLIQM